MEKKCFVVDEWLVHDLLGENGEAAREQTFGFLQRLVAICDRIVVARPSPWVEKAYRLMKESNPPTREMSRFLRLTVLQDSRKCRYIDLEGESSLPADLAAQVPREDLYLVKTYRLADATAIITSDMRLRDALARFPAILVRLRDEFLTEYLER